MSALARRVRVTVLCDNCTAGPGLLAEHGLSLLVETDRFACVFDTGASGVLVGNLARTGLEVPEAAPVVVSHGHYDHTGGLSALLSARGPRPVIAHPEAFSRKYARQGRQSARSIGSPSSRRQLSGLGASWQLSAEPQELERGALTTGVIPRTTDFEPIPPHFAVRRGQKLVQDTFDDEQALAVHTRRGVVVIVGCAHRGLINTLRRALELTGDSHVHAVLGGMHLAAAPLAQVRSTIAELRALGVDRLMACHCTGFGPTVALRTAFGESVSPGGCGAIFTL